MLKHIRLYLITLLMIFSTFAFADEDDYRYTVIFKGIEDNCALLNLLQSTSQLIALQDKPPATKFALRRRAQDDVTNFAKALQTKAYYHPDIQFTIDSTQCPITITFTITPGALYTFSKLLLLPSEEGCSCPTLLQELAMENLGIWIGMPAYPVDIINAEEVLTRRLDNRGYPLNKIVKREVIADEADNTIHVIIYIDTGPLARFGRTMVTGNQCTLLEFFERNIRWNTGAIYCPSLVTRTSNALDSSGLFSSVNITHADSVDDDGFLPMEIDVHEAKRRSIGFGVGYATDLGAGVTAEWEHRNLRGIGDKLSFVATLWQIKQEGFVRYMIPNFCRIGQDLIWQAEYQHETTKGFREESGSLSATIERQIADRLRISYGGMFTRLRNTHSNNNGQFNLFKIPMQLMWNCSNSLLDPTKGYTLHLRTTPALQTLRHPIAYTTHVLTGTAYWPLDANNRFVLAGKATLGSIWGANRNSIPPSERFYAGSDTLLRGYKYWTVSPLGFDNKPLGGRSLMVYSLEARMRVFGDFGLVTFYDIGNVYTYSLPQFDHRQLQSVGLGVRYHTPVGPLRIDIAFPLNRRPHLDSAFQLYFSIGQSF